MTAELEAIVATLEAIHDGVRSAASAAAGREWQRRLDAFARVVEGWLRFAQPHSDAQVAGMLECVVALHAEVVDRTSGVHAVAEPLLGSRYPPRASSFPTEAASGVVAPALRNRAG